MHSVHSLSPVDAPCVPRGHGKQSVDEVEPSLGLYVPDRHFVHDESPVVSP